MDAIQRRTVVGVTGLVSLWVVVYWAWEPRTDREPTVTFTEATDLAPPESGEDAPEIEYEIDDESLSADLIPAGAAEAGSSEGGQGDAGEPADPFGTPPFRWLVARDGDTFQKIARREFGASARWTAIARANPLKDPDRLRAGDRIKIPLDPDNPQGRPEAPAEPPPPPPVVEYTVAPGDTLSGIASRFYGSVSFVDFLYDANRDRLASKDDLRLGQVLVIPAKPGANTGDGG